MGPSAGVPSSCSTASSESRQPWLRRPTRERRSYSTKPSPSGSPGPSIQPSAASTAGAAQLEPVEVAGPHGELGDQQQPERRRVHGAEVRRVRHGAHGGELAAPQLVHDLARLLLAEGVVLTVPCRRPRNETADCAQRRSSSSVSSPTNAISRPNGATNHGSPASGTRSPSITVESRRRSSCPRRSARLSWSLSVKMSVASDSQRSCSCRSAPMRALNSPPASPGAPGPTTWTS